ncbi:MAG: hypothetical protein QGI68_09860 [Pseudomonadales bacterium]|nr:hypothetical protein [Pseudomonadales bacterium]MDP7360732.1 hypothetical protein [Pseudomonadales bacterium]MDP7595857.1 hypothetical protein [Pseudomonadales bacterium]HJN53163.1 hypothetical protein [Pseudomonadales bacterium]
MQWLPIPYYMGNMAYRFAEEISGEDDLDIKDELQDRAKKLAKRSGKPLRAVVEDSLRLALARESESRAYKLPDFSTGIAGADDPLELLSWQDLRDEIYAEPGTQ